MKEPNTPTDAPPPPPQTTLAETMKSTPVGKVLTSLWVTVVLLSFSLCIIFFGTMAQEPMGLNIAVERFFKSWFIDQVAMQAGIVKTAELFGAQWTPVSPEQILGPHGLPVFPGGYLVGSLLLINLVAAYIARFEWSAKKAGIFTSHIGIIVLLFSQLFTDILSEESFVSMERGDRRNFTVSFDDNELAFMLQAKNKSGAVVSNRVVSIPESWLKDKTTATHTQLGKLKIETEQYWVNAKLMTAAQLIDWDAEQQKELEKRVWEKVYALADDRIRQMEAHLDENPAPDFRRSVTQVKGMFFEMRANDVPINQLYDMIGALGSVEARVMGFDEQNPKLIVNSKSLRKLLTDIKGYSDLAEMGRQVRQLMTQQGSQLTYEDFSRQIGRLSEISEHNAGVSPETAKRTIAFAKRLKAASELYRTGTDRGKLGNHYWFVRPLRPAFSQNDRNLPAAIIKISDGDTVLGKWLVSGSVDYLQTLEVGKETWKVTLRAKRHYLDFHLTLVDLKWEKYRGTEIPKNFQSRVIVEDGGESRPVDIFMNNPLRKGGQTFYQYQMNENQLGATVQTMLQVVKNPNWLTAYAGCIIVSIGLLYQFIFHLIGFARRRKKTQA